MFFTSYLSLFLSHLPISSSCLISFLSQPQAFYFLFLPSLSFPLPPQPHFLFFFISSLQCFRLISSIYLNLFISFLSQPLHFLFLLQPIISSSCIIISSSSFSFFSPHVTLISHITARSSNSGGKKWEGVWTEVDTRWVRVQRISGATDAWRSYSRLETLSLEFKSLNTCRELLKCYILNDIFICSSVYPAILFVHSICTYSHALFNDLLWI